MSTTIATQSVRAFLDPAPARWRTVLPIALVMSLADCFVLTALTGAVGAIERTEGRFAIWILDSIVLWPVFIVATLLVLKYTRRKHGAVLRGSRKVLMSALLIAVAGTVIGVAAIAASSAYDYHLQANQLELTGPLHNHSAPAVAVPSAGQSAAAVAASHAGHDAACDDTCVEEHDTLTADLRGVGLSGPILLVVNVVLVGWLLALFGGRLGPVVRRVSTAVAAPSETTV
jgi:heme/copper-type cytochrome/quinol oxidase subunit 2